MKIVSWNVNSLRVRLPAVTQWLQQQRPAVLCLQETKLVDENFPVTELLAIGYRSFYAGQKTYNGVAILVRDDLPTANEIQINIPGFEDEQKRMIAATIAGVRVVCGYFPNGQAVDSDKYGYKLRWLQALTAWLQTQLPAYPRLAVAGDYNIAPTDDDVHDPTLWAGKVLCSEPERDAFRHLLGLGLKDSFRLFEQPPRSYSWWDYRELAFRRKRGLRIDHILVTESLAAVCRASGIDIEPRRQEQASDHAPVWAEFQV